MSALPFNIVPKALPASRKIYRAGQLHSDVRVPIREITLHPSANEPPVLVYDSSGPYTDPNAHINIERGLPALRAPWIAARNDIEAYIGRVVQPVDNGLIPGGET